jgi:hypothetical protein
MVQLADPSFGSCCCFSADLSNLHQGINNLARMNLKWVIAVTSSQSIINCCVCCIALASQLSAFAPSQHSIMFGVASLKIALTIWSTRLTHPQASIPSPNPAQQLLLRTLSASLLDTSCWLTVSAVAVSDGSITECALSATNLAIQACNQLKALVLKLYCCLRLMALTGRCGSWRQKAMGNMVTKFWQSPGPPGADQQLSRNQEM